MDKSNLKSLVDDAILFFSLGEELDAKKILDNALDLEPTYLPALRAMAEVCLSMNQLNKAEDYCRKALLSDEKDLASIVSLARILVKKGDKLGAEKASADARILGWQEELSSE